MKAEWFKKWDDDGEYDRDYWARTSEVESGDDSTSTSGWWDRFHGNGKKSSYTPVKSTSAYLRSTSDCTDWTSKGSRKDDLLEVLKEVNKTINLTINSQDGKSERALVARYSDGSFRNDLTNNSLFISPNVLLDKNGNVLDKSDDNYYSGLDALNGQAMLCSFMRKSVTPSANNQYVCCDNWAIRNLYMTDLQTTAGNEIRSDWPGFQSYIEAQHRTFASSKDKVIADLMSPDQNIDNFVNLLCYNRLSSDRIDYNSLFEQDIANRMMAADDLLNEVMDSPVDNDLRFERAINLFSELQKIIDLNNPSPSPSGNDSQDGEKSEKNNSSGDAGSSGSDGEDNDSDSDQNDSDSDGDVGNGNGKINVSSIDTNSASELNRRFTGDNSYNNHVKVHGSFEASEVDPNGELMERLNVEHDKLKIIKDAQINDACYRRLVPPVNPTTKESYKRFVRSHRTAINNVKNCFQFHNTDYSLSTYGLASGGIDDGSFHKVFLGESERLYERRDVKARKKWLVTVLIDQSGSMGVMSSDDKSRMQHARNLSIIFAEALKSLKEVDFSIYGFSTSSNIINTYVYQDKQTNKLEALTEAGHHNGTGIGFHVAHVGDKMTSQYPDHDNKILFVITDGEPNARPTSSMDGYEHTNHCCELLRKRGINVFGIGIANAFGNDIGDRLFGQGNFTVINDVQSTLNVLTNSLRNFFKRMKK